jgi:hypothetical protein
MRFVGRRAGWILRFDANSDANSDTGGEIGVDSHTPRNAALADTKHRDRAELTLNSPPVSVLLSS